MRTGKSGVFTRIDPESVRHAVCDASSAIGNANRSTLLDMIDLLGGERRRNESQALLSQDVRDKRTLEAAARRCTTVASNLQRTCTQSRRGVQPPRLGKRQIDACIDTLLDACLEPVQRGFPLRVRVP